MLKFVATIITIILILLLPIISHIPFFGLSTKDKEHIKENGLIHFTTADRLQSIFSNGLIGEVSNDNIFEERMGKMVWMYEYKTPDDVVKKHERLMEYEGSNLSSNYTVCLKLTGFSDDTLRQMRTRHGIFSDHAIVYKGSRLVAGQIEIVPEQIYNTNDSANNLRRLGMACNEVQ